MSAHPEVESHYLFFRKNILTQTYAPKINCTVYCSIYDPAFWDHERYWKFSLFSGGSLLNGTPFKSAALRLLGVRVGKKLFDDGCVVTEMTLVTIGSYCTLNRASTMQSHSLEDGTFKSDHIVIGDGCTLGTNAFRAVRRRDGK